MLQQPSAHQSADCRALPSTCWQKKQGLSAPAFCEAKTTTSLDNETRQTSLSEELVFARRAASLTS